MQVICRRISHLVTARHVHVPTFAKSCTALSQYHCSTGAAYGRTRALTHMHGRGFASRSGTANTAAAKSNASVFGHDYDIVVVGAGMVGSALACRLGMCVSAVFVQLVLCISVSIYLLLATGQDKPGSLFICQQCFVAEWNAVACVDRISTLHTYVHI
jgi:hypothetical protein